MIWLFLCLSAWNDEYLMSVTGPGHVEHHCCHHHHGQADAWLIRLLLLQCTVWCFWGLVLGDKHSSVSKKKVKHWLDSAPFCLSVVLSPEISPLHLVFQFISLFTLSSSDWTWVDFIAAAQTRSASFPAHKSPKGRLYFLSKHQSAAPRTGKFSWYKPPKRSRLFRSARRSYISGEVTQTYKSGVSL